MSAGRVSKGYQPSPVSFIGGCVQPNTAWSESDGWWLKKLFRLSRELRVNCSKGVAYLGPPLPGHESSGNRISNQEPWSPAGSLSIFIQPGFLPFPAGAQTESKGESWGEFPWISQFSSLIASHPAATVALLSTATICPRERVGGGCPRAAGQESRWPCEGTKDCESTLDAEGTSQTRTFKGLPSLHSAICVNGEETPFGRGSGH